MSTRLTAEPHTPPFCFCDIKSGLWTWDAEARYSGSGGENHFQILQFHNHPFIIPRDERLCFSLTVHLVQWSWAQRLPHPAPIISIFFFLYFGRVCFKFFLRVLEVLHDISFNSPLFCAPFLCFYFELICEPLFAAKWVSRDRMLMDLIGLGSTLFWNKRSQYTLMVHSITEKALLPGSNRLQFLMP